jgi:hypothetical protein
MRQAADAGTGAATGPGGTRPKSGGVRRGSGESGEIGVDATTSGEVTCQLSPSGYEL